MTYSERAKQIFQEEIAELSQLAEHIDSSFDDIVHLIYTHTGLHLCQQTHTMQQGTAKLVVMGIGKTGIIGHKIASSLASTGTPSIFVNAAEAVHGDLGMISAGDIVMLVSNSGATGEILNVIAPLKKIGCTLIAMTGNSLSPLAKECDYILPVHVDHETCPLGLAPTTSTTATLLMGDALMVCLMELRKFKAENFAIYHPGGALGRQLLCRVCNRMTTRVPRVLVSTPFRDVVCEMSDKHLGMTMVYEGNTCVGIITDGDVRRTIQRYDNISDITAGDIMTPSYKRIAKNTMLTEALAEMDKYNITTLAVTETEQTEEIIGIISIHHIIDFN